MSGVRRGDGERESEAHARDIAEFRRGMQAYAGREGYDAEAGPHWRDGWIHAAEVAQQRSEILDHLDLLRSALMGAYRLIKNAPTPKKPMTFLQKQDRDGVLVNINLALAHVPARNLERAIQ